MNSQLLGILVGAAIGSVITVIGWFVNHRFALRKEDEARRKETVLKHLEKQIEELYGPLWGLLQKVAIVNDVANKRLPTQSSSKPGSKIDRDSFNQEHAEIWNYLMLTYFLPINAKVSELIRTKAYLIDSSDIPPSFHHFLKHEAQIEVLHRLWVDKGVVSTDVPGISWPHQFNEEIDNTLRSLKRRYQDYLEQTSEPAGG